MCVNRWHAWVPVATRVTRCCRARRCSRAWRPPQRRTSRPIRCSAGGAPAPARFASASRSRSCSPAPCSRPTPPRWSSIESPPRAVGRAVRAVRGARRLARRRPAHRPAPLLPVPVYRLRLIAEDLFGKDVSLPETKLSYRVQSRSRRQERGAAGARPDLPAAAAVGARDVARAGRRRPTSATRRRETFSDLDQRAFRANLFTIIGGVLFALAGLMALLALVRLVRALPARPRPPADRLMTDGAILRGVGRELAAVRRERDGSGWTPDLAGRALAALRDCRAPTCSGGRSASCPRTSCRPKARTSRRPAG